MSEQYYFWPVFDYKTQKEFIIELPGGETPKGLSDGGPYSMYGPRFDSLEKLHAACGLTEECVECGSLIRTSFIEPMKSRMTAQRVCHTCDFWRGLAAAVERLTVADGSAYEIRPDSGREFAGFGGRQFVIEFNDGRKVTTRNLWHRGVVPEHFRARIPNNARFVNGEHWSNDGPGAGARMTPHVAPEGQR